MRVLLITPNVDVEHAILGFLHYWADELAKHVDSLDILTFRAGKFSFNNKNIQVFDLSSPSRIMKFLKLNYYLFKLVPKNDVVYIQMYPFLALISYPYVKIFGKKMVMWYTHRCVTSTLLLVNKLVDKVMTAANNTYRINTHKKEILGHGIVFSGYPNLKRIVKKRGKKFIILSVGRISPIKKFEVLLDAINILVNKKNYKNIECLILGPVYDDKYYKKLLEIVEMRNLNSYVKFLGPVPHKKIKEIYMKADLFVSTSQSGLDKAPLESMALGIYTLICGSEYLEYFDKELKEKCYYDVNNINELVEKIEYFIKNKDKEEKLRLKMMHHVLKHHSIESHAKKVKRVLEEVVEG